jgi:Uma2 family endonuclease
MVANSKFPPESRDGRLSEAQYLEAEAHREIKHEYIDGYSYAMTGASRSHNLIVGNSSTLLNVSLRLAEVYQQISFDEPSSAQGE